MGVARPRASYNPAGSAGNRYQGHDLSPARLSFFMAASCFPKLNSIRFPFLPFPSPLSPPPTIHSSAPDSFSTSPSCRRCDPLADLFPAPPTLTALQITEIFFDCDNTLVLSEELAFEACADLANEILEKRGIPDRYTGSQLIKDFVGQNFRGMMISLQAKYKFEMEKPELEEYVTKEEDKVIAKLEAKAQPCVGATEELEKLFASKKYGMAVVSSSALRRVRASIKKVDQDKYFEHDKIFSAATSLEKPTSKPDPAIYLHALDYVKKTAAETVAVEDSKSGALSAIRAGIPVIGYVGSYHGEELQTEMSKRLIDLGAKVIMTNWTEFEKCMEVIENGPEAAQSTL